MWANKANQRAGGAYVPHSEHQVLTTNQGWNFAFHITAAWRKKHPVKNTKQTKENHQEKVIWATMKQKSNCGFQDFGDCFQILEKCSHGNKFLDTVRIADAHYFCTETVGKSSLLTFAFKLVRSPLCSDLYVFTSITYIYFISASTFTYCFAMALSG